MDPGLLPGVVEFFGPGVPARRDGFTLVDLVNELGIGVFDGGRVEAESFRLRSCSGPPTPLGPSLALRHVAYQELLAAEFLRSARGP